MYVQGDLTSSLNPAMQALRVWNRALANISRLSVAQESTAETKGATPFASTVTDLQAPLPDHADASRRKPVQLSSQNSGLVWSLSDVSSLYLLPTAVDSAGYAVSCQRFSPCIESLRPARNTKISRTFRSASYRPRDGSRIDKSARASFDCSSGSEDVRWERCRILGRPRSRFWNSRSGQLRAPRWRVGSDVRYDRTITRRRSRRRNYERIC